MRLSTSTGPVPSAVPESIAMGESEQLRLTVVELKVTALVPNPAPSCESLTFTGPNSWVAGGVCAKSAGAAERQQARSESVVQARDFILRTASMPFVAQATGKGRAAQTTCLVRYCAPGIRKGGDVKDPGSGRKTYCLGQSPDSRYAVSTEK